MSKLNAIHIMKDGTRRENIEGAVIRSEEFYQVLQGIIEKRAVKA